MPPPDPAILAHLSARPRLLLVDDHPINIQVLNQIFHEDHEVFVATSGEQALDFCRETPPDLILLDVVMPGMDGLEVCRRLKADPSTADIPVIFVTAHSGPEEETRALAVGGVDFITKPVTPAVVRARVRTHLLLKAHGDLLRALVFVDGLTGVANRRRFDEALQAEWRRNRRSQRPLCLLMLDIDHFKNYNDAFGHQQGDVCLQMVARALSARLGRAADLVARYGGEEFACLLPDCEPAAALGRAQDLRAAVEALALPHPGSSAGPVVTISVGVACMQAGADTDPAGLVAAADAALYAAKRAGRNQVCPADPILCPGRAGTGQRADSAS